MADRPTRWDLYGEIATLSQDLATSEAACASAMAENVALTEDLAKARRIIESIDAAALLRPETVPTVTLAEDLDRLRSAVRHLLDLYDSGNVLGTIAAIPGLREALDGGT